MLIVRRSAASDYDPATLYLPQELVDQIVGYLCDDIKSLRYCSMVCVSMLAMSSKYLLRKLRISTTRLPLFLLFLRSSTRLPKYITILRLEDDRRELFPSFLYNAVLLLPNLTTFHFIGSFSSFSSGTSWLPRGPRRPIKTISFENLHLDLVECVLELFGAVDRLRISGRYVDGNLATPRIMGEVKNLYIQLGQGLHIDRLMLFQPSCLSSVEINSGHHGSVASYELDRFLQINGGHIEKLTILLPAGGLQPMGNGEQHYSRSCATSLMRYASDEHINVFPSARVQPRSLYIPKMGDCTRHSAISPVSDS